MKKEKYFFNTPSEKKRLEIKFDPAQAKQQLLDMGFKKGMRFLDAGCGTGAMVRTVKGYDPKNKHIYGVDANKKFLTFSSSLKSRNRADYYAGNLYKLPFKDKSFDFVWTRFVLEHLINPLAAIKEMKRVLKKGGIIAMGDLDGNCVYHYPINPDFERNLNTILKSLGPYGFDPFIGRKLFYFLRALKFANIHVKLYPYHNIFGRPDQNDWLNWNIKINGTIKFLEKNRKLSRVLLKKIKKQWLSYILDKNTYTYSVLIFAKGVK
jgi:ubiquinone/menaquinone biosynthesis C-methylase UbiE